MPDEFKLTLSFDAPVGDVVYVISTPGVPSQVQRAFEQLRHEIEEGHRSLSARWGPTPTPPEWKPSQEILDRIRVQAAAFAKSHHVHEDTVVELVTARVTDACVGEVLREVERREWREYTYGPLLVDPEVIAPVGEFRRHWLNGVINT